MSITYNGTSADYPQPIDGELSDRELRRIGEELVRSGDLPGLWLKDLPHRVFEQFVVDRIHSPKGGLRIYLRPKVPFGNGPARGANGSGNQAAPAGDAAHRAPQPRTAASSSLMGVLVGGPARDTNPWGLYGDGDGV